MCTLSAVERVLRDTKEPMSVRAIVERAGENLPTRSRTPTTVVARDLSMDIKRKGDESNFARTSPGRYTLREFVTHPGVASTVAASVPTRDESSAQHSVTSILGSTLDGEARSTKPAQTRGADTRAELEANS